jgi:hypothetical protein
VNRFCAAARINFLSGIILHVDQGEAALWIGSYCPAALARGKRMKKNNSTPALAERMLHSAKADV